ncbi:MAG: hypothetical protein WC685_06655 [Methylobacter sp.]
MTSIYYRLGYDCMDAGGRAPKVGALGDAETLPSIAQLDILLQ